jgi:thiamine-monophosphate kinase
VGLGEFELIRRFFWRPSGSPAASDGVLLGIGDDAALLRVPAGADLAATVDTIVEGRHFPAGSDARSIGHRALAVNLSDLAAMGATPAWATLALTLPEADAAWLERFAEGLFGLADAYRVALVGGDTARGPLTITLQLLGHVPAGAALRRGGARAGDLLAVTGTLGDAGAGLAFLQQAPAHRDDARVGELVRRFEYPAPRIEFGLAARGIAAAAMDLSDGLIGDAAKFAEANQLAAHVEVERLPISPALREVVPASQSRDWALGAGDDYELLVAVAPQRLGELQGVADGLGLALTRIGELRPGRGVFFTLDGRIFTPQGSGFDHFR